MLQESENSKNKKSSDISHFAWRKFSGNKYMWDYLKQNGFDLEKEFRKYKKETEKIKETAEDLETTIVQEQTNFDNIYIKLEEVDIEKIELDDRDIKNMKEELKQKFGKEFKDSAISKAERQFNDYDNGNPSTKRMLDKNVRAIKRRDERNKKENTKEHKSAMAIMNRTYNRKVLEIAQKTWEKGIIQSLLIRLNYM